MNIIEKSMKFGLTFRVFLWGQVRIDDILPILPQNGWKALCFRVAAVRDAFNDERNNSLIPTQENEILDFLIYPAGPGAVGAANYKQKAGIFQLSENRLSQ